MEKHAVPIYFPHKMNTGGCLHLLLYASFLLISALAVDGVGSNQKIFYTLIRDDNSLSFAVELERNEESPIEYHLKNWDEVIFEQHDKAENKGLITYSALSKDGSYCVLGLLITTKEFRSKLVFKGSEVIEKTVLGPKEYFMNAYNSQTFSLLRTFKVVLEQTATNQYILNKHKTVDLGRTMLAVSKTANSFVDFVKQSSQRHDIFDEIEGESIYQWNMDTYVLSKMRGMAAHVLTKSAELDKERRKYFAPGFYTASVSNRLYCFGDIKNIRDEFYSPQLYKECSMDKTSFGLCNSRPAFQNTYFITIYSAHLTTGALFLSTKIAGTFSTTEGHGELGKFVVKRGATIQKPGNLRYYLSNNFTTDDSDPTNEVIVLPTESNTFSIKHGVTRIAVVYKYGELGEMRLIGRECAAIFDMEDANIKVILVRISTTCAEFWESTTFSVEYKESANEPATTLFFTFDSALANDDLTYDVHLKQISIRPSFKLPIIAGAVASLEFIINQFTVWRIFGTCEENFIEEDKEFEFNAWNEPPKNLSDVLAAKQITVEIKISKIVNLFEKADVMFVRRGDEYGNFILKWSSQICTDSSNADSSNADSSNANSNAIETNVSTTPEQQEGSVSPTSDDWRDYDEIPLTSTSQTARMRKSLSANDVSQLLNNPKKLQEDITAPNNKKELYTPPASPVQERRNSPINILKIHFDTYLKCSVKRCDRYGKAIINEDPFEAEVSKSSLSQGSKQITCKASRLMPGNTYRIDCDGHNEDYFRVSWPLAGDKVKIDFSKAEHIFKPDLTEHVMQLLDRKSPKWVKSFKIMAEVVKATNEPWKYVLSNRDKQDQLSPAYFQDFALKHVLPGDTSADLICSHGPSFLRLEEPFLIHKVGKFLETCSSVEGALNLENYMDFNTSGEENYFGVRFKWEGIQLCENEVFVLTSGPLQTNPRYWLKYTIVRSKPYLTLTEAPRQEIVLKEPFRFLHVYNSNKKFLETLFVQLSEISEKHKVPAYKIYDLNSVLKSEDQVNKLKYAISKLAYALPYVQQKYTCSYSEEAGLYYLILLVKQDLQDI